MQSYNIRQYVELFHLLFLDQLGRKLAKNLYALKGGCNLRFFFNSIRYSEDIDLDIKIIAKETLRKKVNDILSSVPFKQILQTKKIMIHEATEPKQTNTVQRWEINIQTPISTQPLPTKIEFSRHNLAHDVLFESINPAVLHQYLLPPIMTNHYSVQSAFEQKVSALINRTNTQARDIFDLYWLLASGFKLSLTNAELIASLQKAKENAHSLSFDDFKGQVVAYLPDDYQMQYGDKQVWQQIIKTVIEALEKT